ncbi:MAG: hypothetical protein ACYDDN_06400 [Candidatus Desulforudaceae bacterium]
MSELTPEERQRIYEEEKARQEAQEKINTEVQAKKNKKMGIGCLVIVALTLLFVVAVSGGGGSDPANNTSAPAEPRPEHSAIEAYSMSQEFCRNNLKAPSTAKFPWTAQAVVDLGDGEYKVSSYVDAENSFGAKIRTNYICTVKYVGEDKWRLLEFEFQ